MSEVWKGFCVLEGIDGAGKSAAIGQLKELYMKKGKGAVSFASEPASARNTRSARCLASLAAATKRRRWRTLKRRRRMRYELFAPCFL